MVWSDQPKGGAANDSTRGNGVESNEASRTCFRQMDLKTVVVFVLPIAAPGLSKMALCQRIASTGYV